MLAGHSGHSHSLNQWLSLLFSVPSVPTSLWNSFFILSRSSFCISLRAERHSLICVLSGWRGTSLYFIGIPDGITVHFLAAERFDGERQLNGYDFLSFSFPLPPALSKSWTSRELEALPSISRFSIKTGCAGPGTDILLSCLTQFWHRCFRRQPSNDKHAERKKKKREKTDQTEQDNLVKNNPGQENRCHFDVLKQMHWFQYKPAQVYSDSGALGRTHVPPRPMMDDNRIQMSLLILAQNT